MSTIEQAIARLEALARAGVTLPPQEGGGTADAPAAQRAPQRATRLDTEEGSAPRVRVEIDLAGLATQGLLTPDAPRSRISEEFRLIKRPVIDNARGKSASAILRGNLVMVTSALPGEGKSFSAVNLAMSLAQEQDTTVLLVDADVARPSLMRMFGLPPARGLMDVLAGDATLEDTLLGTQVEKLTLLPAGMPHERATEMLASRTMHALMEDLASRHDNRIVVFDSPPLLATTEARVLASRMGQVVLVVEAMRTSQGAVRQALATIEACPVKLMMLNKGTPRELQGYGGYGYGGYGYGATR